jgi:hypothetical protein
LYNYRWESALADMDDAVALQAKLSDVKGRVLFEDWQSHDGPLSEELTDRMEWAISELGTLSSEFATGQIQVFLLPPGLLFLQLTSWVVWAKGNRA